MLRWSSRTAFTGALRPAARGERRGERLGTATRAEVDVTGGRAGEQVTGPEAPRVDVDELMSIGEVDPHPRVGGRRRGIQQQRAGHPQVHEQRSSAAEIPHQVLAGAVDLHHGLSLEARRDLVGRLGHRPARVADLHPRQRASLQVRRELAADRLDLRQLGHHVYL
jgi:hypothetical protein